MTQRKYYIETYGCQMNAADSELVAGLLEEMQLVACSDPSDADLIIVNSCSVRAGADARALARLSQFKSLKAQNPRLRLGLIGCVAQRDKGKIIAQRPYIDFVLGPDSYRQIPTIINDLSTPVVQTHLSCIETYEGLLPRRQKGVNAWIPIMRGCNKFCSFCIVPYVRGRERSRSVDSILQEVKQAVSDGFKEVTLLGQNVNSYQYESYRFADLLDAIARVEGLYRIRYTSPHPADISIYLLEVMRAHKNICKHIHLPLQAGSDRILQAMNRNYTQNHYLQLVETIRKYLLDVAITTDIIVGFPGETESDFLQTVKVMETVIFDAAFMFQYSPRPGTKAAQLVDDVPLAEKQKRLEQIIALQKMHTLQRNQALVGTVQEILIEGNSKKRPGEKIGRTDTNKITIIKNGQAEIGSLVEVRIDKALGVSLFGSVLNQERAK